MSRVRNILFIMCDQLRWDHLSCYGHPALATPNIDGLARIGVRFAQAFVQSPVCGPSRMSFYTGRTVFSHGATWNGVPLPIGEYTIGDYLRGSGMRVAVAGKTHFSSDTEGMTRLGLTTDTRIGSVVAEGGFEPFERDDGLHPGPIVPTGLHYNDWLRLQGYNSANPWNDFANSAEGPNGELLSGWQLRNSKYPARVKEEHSETAFITDRAIEFVRASGDRPWLLHLSYIKPHWPYMAPAPYHDMFGPNAFLPRLRDSCEHDDPHPVYRAFCELEVSREFSRDEVRETVLPAYMGLVKQIDDQLGRLLGLLQAQGRMSDTLIVFTSDHGDYLGDHWLGEKELFHEQSVKVPLIIYDPALEADAKRGSVEHRLVEAIDLVPTFLETLALELPTHRLEGRSLSPLLRDQAPSDWRNSVFSELDYSFYRTRLDLQQGPNDCRAYMIRTDRWKYVAYRGFRPQLFDLQNDANEFIDLGQSSATRGVVRDMQELLVERLTARRNRVALSDAEVVRRTDTSSRQGIIIGKW